MTSQRIIRVLLIGPMPPPSGGVSVHLSRLLGISLDQEGLALSVLDIRRMRLHTGKRSTRNIFLILKEFFLSDMVHLHVSKNIKYFLAVFSKLCAKKLVYTHHNSRLLSDRGTWKTMKLAAAIILVRDLRDALPQSLAGKASVIPAYLPALETSVLPPELEEQLTGTLIFSHCYQQRNAPLLVDGLDLYGFDLIFDALETLLQEGLTKPVTVLLCDPNEAMTEVYRNRVMNLNTAGKIRIIYWTKELDFTSLFSRAELLIRASRSDGDAVSVREALNAGITVVASDCVERPEGTCLFRTGDAASLAEMLGENLDKKVVVKHPQKDYSNDIFRLYHSLR